MARPTKQEALAIQERRNRVAELYLRGMTQARIAAQEGVDPSQIARDLAVVREDWKAYRATEYGAKLDEEVARIDHLERVAQQAWERSCQNAEVTHASKVKGRTTRDGTLLPDLDKVTKTVKGQAGDPRFLERVAWCVEMRLRLIGALKQQHEVTGRAGGPVDVKVYIPENGRAGVG